MSEGKPPVFEIELGPGLSWVLFSPAEADEITGLSPVMQGDWRRRDILPKHKGHARFNALDIAEMWLLKMLSDRGVGPQHSKPMVRRGAEGVVLAALQKPEAWSKDYRKGRTPKPWMYDQWFSKYFNELNAGRFLVWWADGSSEWVDNLSAAFAISTFDDAKSGGPLILLDTKTIGAQLTDKAGRPLVYVQTAPRRRRD